MAKSAAQDVAQYLFLEKAPAWIRVSTVAPLSNYGYPEGSEGALLKAGAKVADANALAA